MLFGADSDLKTKAHSTAKTPAWLKIPLTANGRNLISKKSPDAFHSVNAGKKTTFLSFCISCTML